MGHVANPWLLDENQWPRFQKKNSLAILRLLPGISILRTEYGNH